MGRGRLSEAQAVLNTLAAHDFRWFVLAEGYMVRDVSRITIEIRAELPDAIETARCRLEAAPWVTEYIEQYLHLRYGYSGDSTARLSFGVLGASDAHQVRTLVSRTLGKGPCRV